MLRIVQVWIAYAKFELANSSAEADVDNVVLARRIFERGNDALRSNGDKESRALLLEAWRDFEHEKGDEETRSKIIEKMPRRIKRRRRIVGEDGVNKFIIFLLHFSNVEKTNRLTDIFFHLQSDDGWEEVFDFVFPEDESQRPNLKFLASAKAWMKQKEISENISISTSHSETSSQNSIVHFTAKMT